MSDELLNRIRAGLEWPEWEAWSDHRATPVPPAAQSAAPAVSQPVNSAERAAEIQRRRALARTVDRGGPWLQLFDDAAGRLAAEDGRDLGPLAMRTFAIKALVAVAGYPTTAASPVRADAPAETATAPIVTRLAAAGAIPMGLVTMHEFAFGVTGVNDQVGTAPNPAAPERVPGGSSSGSASSVADGSAGFAIGTDTGGSVRIPSAFCGVAGFKPAHGTYPTAGVFPLSTTLDHVGLHAPTAGEIAEIHAALGFRTLAASLPRRVGVVWGDLERAEPEIATAVEAAISRLADAGVGLVDVELPDPEMAFVASTAIMFSEAAAAHAADVAAHRDRYGADILARLEIGARLTGPQVGSAHRLRHQIIDQVQATLSEVDVIVNPTVPILAPRVADAADPALSAKIVSNTRLANVVGLPAATIPAPGGHHPPVGLQFLGADNATVLATAEATEAVLT